MAPVRLVSVLLKPGTNLVESSAPANSEALVRVVVEQLQLVADGQAHDVARVQEP